MKVPTLTRYTYIFAAFNLLLLLIAAFVVVVVLGWRTLLTEPVGSNPNIYTRLTVSDIMVYSGFVFSGASILTALLSIWTLASKPTRDKANTRPLGVYLIVILGQFLFTMAVATVIWFTTLRERKTFTPEWERLPDAQRIYIQDDLKCCGWFNATVEGIFTEAIQSGFCANPETLKRDPDPNVVIGCIDKFIKKADDIMNNTFTITYGFTAVQLGLFLSAACIANLRMQQKRFLRIDFKFRQSGKGGFV